MLVQRVQKLLSIVLVALAFVGAASAQPAAGQDPILRNPLTTLPQPPKKEQPQVSLGEPIAIPVNDGGAPVLRSGQALSLNDVQGIALAQNPEVLQASLEVSRSTATLKSIIAQRYPKMVSLTFIGQQVTSGYSQNLAVLPGIFEPVTQQYRLGMQVREAKLGVQVSQQRLRLARQRIVADVKSLYLSMVALRSAVNNLENNLGFLRELEHYVEAEVNRGQALSVDALVVQARVARADYDVDKAKDDLTTMGQSLNRLLGRPIRSEINLVDEVFANSPELKEDELNAEALRKRPELNELKLSVHRSSLERKVILSNYIPDVSFGATSIISRNLDITLPRSFTSVGFLAIWEPWDWGRKIQLGKETEAKMQQEKIKLRYESDSVSIEVDKAWRDVRLSVKEAKAGAMAEESAKEQLRVTYRRFRAGAALLKDVLESQSAYTKAIAENVKAKTDIAAASVELDQALGRDF